jgi:hypothetical protein
MGPSLHVPKHPVATDAIPLLGAGKTDNAAARALVAPRVSDLDEVDVSDVIV